LPETVPCALDTRDEPGTAADLSARRDMPASPPAPAAPGKATARAQPVQPVQSARPLQPGRRHWLAQTSRAAAGLGTLALGGVPLAAHAGTPGVDEPPEPGPVQALELPNFQEFRLPNGLTVIVAPGPGGARALPLVSARLVLRTGSRADPADRAGLAALTADLMAKGAMRAGKRVDALTLARQAEALGAELATGAGDDALSVNMTVMSTRLPAAVALMADVLRRPLLAADELDRLRSRAQDSLKVSLADPAALASRVARKLWWGQGPSAAVTTQASLARISAADAQAFHQRWARPDLAALVLVGPIDVAAARNLAEHTLGDWARPADPAPGLQAQPPAPLGWPVVLVDLPGTGQSAVLLMAPAVDDESPDRRAAQIANEVLGGGYSSRLNQQVRTRRGLAYGASSHVDLQRAGGALVAFAQTDHSHAAEVQTLIRDAVTGMAASAPPREELQARQSALVGQFGRRFDTVEGCAAVVGGRWARGRPLAELRQATGEWLAVSGADVERFARQYWANPAAQRCIVVGDLARIGPALDGLGQPALRLQARELDLDQPLPAAPAGPSR
jgi:zinc protease